MKKLFIIGFISRLLAGRRRRRHINRMRFTGLNQGRMGHASRGRSRNRGRF